MTTVNIDATTGGWVSNYHAVWDTAKDAITGDSAHALTGDSINLSVYYDSEDEIYFIGRNFLGFDASVIPAGSTINSAVLKLYGFDNEEDAVNVSVLEGTQANPLTTDDYNNFTGTEYCHATMTLNQYSDFTFSAGGIADVEAAIGGTVKIALMNYDYDYLDSAPEGGAFGYVSLGANLPYLAIDYTPLGPTTCKFYMRDNKLTTISGADAGSYLLQDNYANIAVGGVVYRRSPFDMTISQFDSDGNIIMKIG
jgi:hypothetical protein